MARGKRLRGKEGEEKFVPGNRDLFRNKRSGKSWGRQNHTSNTAAAGLELKWNFLPTSNVVPKGVQGWKGLDHNYSSLKVSNSDSLYKLLQILIGFRWGGQQRRRTLLSLVESSSFCWWWRDMSLKAKQKSEDRNLLSNKIQEFREGWKGYAKEMFHSLLFASW